MFMYIPKNAVGSLHTSAEERKAVVVYYYTFSEWMEFSCEK